MPYPDTSILRNAPTRWLDLLPHGATRHPEVLAAAIRDLAEKAAALHRAEAARGATSTPATTSTATPARDAA